MTAKDLFSEEEWKSVSRAPFMTGVFIVSSDMSDAVGIVRELLTVEALIADEAGKPHGFAFAKDVFADIESGNLSTDVGVLDDHKETRVRALGSVTAAAQLVAAKAPAESAAYQAWLLQIAHGVAEATRESGGVLGFARRISADEKMALSELQRALDAVSAED